MFRWHFMRTLLTQCDSLLSLPSLTRQTLSSSIVTKMLDSRRVADAGGGAAVAGERGAHSDAAAGAAAFAGKRVSYCVAGSGAEDGAAAGAVVVGGVIRQKQKRRFPWEGELI